MIGIKAVDITCTTCGADSGERCGTRGRLCQSRINAATKLTRDANRALAAAQGQQRPDAQADELGQNQPPAHFDQSVQTDPADE